MSYIVAVISRAAIQEATYIRTTFLILKFSKGVESGSWPLSFWITICCIILSRSSQYWTVLPLLLSKQEKNSGNTSSGFKTLMNIFQQGSPARVTEPDRTRLVNTSLPKYLESGIIDDLHDWEVLLIPFYMCCKAYIYF